MQKNGVKRSGLPPVLEGIKEGNVTWRRLEEVDYETLGYFLSCHLIIEHYLTEALKTQTWPRPELRWEAAKLTFSQKLQIFPPLVGAEKFQSLIPCLKHLNSLRNKFSHDIRFRLSDPDLEPFIRFLNIVVMSPNQLPTEPTQILEIFTAVCCAFFAGRIELTAETFKGPLDLGRTREH